MKTLRLFFAGFIMIALTFSWTLPKVSGQDYYTQQDQNKTILKEAVVGAGVGAIASSASGGSAGKGALIGAGANVIGNALVDTLTSPQPSQPQVQYVQQVPEHQNGGCGRSR